MGFTRRPVCHPHITKDLGFRLLTSFPNEVVLQSLYCVYKGEFVKYVHLNIPKAFCNPLWIFILIFWEDKNRQYLPHAKDHLTLSVYETT